MTLNVYPSLGARAEDAYPWDTRRMSLFQNKCYLQPRTNNKSLTVRHQKLRWNTMEYDGIRWNTMEYDGLR